MEDQVSIEREHYDGPITFLCDGPRCHEFCETHCTDFGGALAKLKSRGWVVRKDGRDWTHLCGDCK